jgi:exopolyphosphatase/guanosine-5'-triphosphate,3'-diphosphate pyrophosphatase
MPESQLLAAIDLGSNSFRLLVAQSSGPGPDLSIRPVDSVKRSVRLAAGLDRHQRLDAAAQLRGLEALNVFSQRLRAYAPSAVRAVATNALRVARNASDFLADAQAVLGYPIEVISGHEEARLIWVGASHALNDSRRKLVIDIGGGSTECILGDSGEPSLLDSISVGCVSAITQQPADITLDRQSFERARRALGQRFAKVAKDARKFGWERAIGTSGTAKALLQVARESFERRALNRGALEQMIDALFSREGLQSAIFACLKPDRRAVLVGGVLVMSAVFDEFGLESIEYCEAALRDGILLELSSAMEGDDVRERTVSQMVKRYGVEPARSGRVTLRALALFDQAARTVREERLAKRALLEWAGRLAEVGKIVADEDFHRHSAYILRYADMPGFNRSEQQTLANLALGQTGGLRKLRGLFADELGWLAVLALRVANLMELASPEASGEAPLPALFFKNGEARLELGSKWLDRNPQVHQALSEEIRRWTDAQLVSRFELRKL